MKHHAIDMKDIKCKCSHLKSEHKKGILKFTECDNCPCSKFINVDYPNKSQKFGIWYNVTYGIFITIALSCLLFYFESIDETVLSEIITVHLFKVVFYGLLTIMIVIALGWFTIDSMLAYRIKKKRKDWN